MKHVRSLCRRPQQINRICCDIPILATCGLWADSIPVKRFPPVLTETHRYDRSDRKTSMKSRPASPCQRGGRGFEPRLVLQKTQAPSVGSTGGAFAFGTIECESPAELGSNRGCPRKTWPRRQIREGCADQWRMTPALAARVQRAPSRFPWTGHRQDWKVK